MSDSSSSPESNSSSSRRKLAIRLIIAVVAVAGAVMYGQHAMQEIVIRNQYNAYVSHLMDNGHYEAAIDCFTALKADATGQTRSQIEGSLAQCYAQLARSTDGDDAQRHYLAAAYELDPKVLADSELALIGQ